MNAFILNYMQNY